MAWKNPGRSGAIIYALAASLIGALATAVTRLTISRHRGRQTAVARLPAGPIIIISNHASYADGVLLALTCRRMGRSIRLLATTGVFKAPVLGTLARRVGFIPVARNSSSAGDALDLAVEALNAGEAVGIFPEGRTTRDPNLWPERSKTGAVRLAIQTGAPIVPIAMVGTHRVLPRKRPALALIRNLILRPSVLVEVGEPIDVQNLADRLRRQDDDQDHDNNDQDQDHGAGIQQPSPDEIRQIADQVMNVLVELVATARGEAPPVKAQP